MFQFLFRQREVVLEINLVLQNFVQTFEEKVGGKFLAPENDRMPELVVGPHLLNDEYIQLMMTVLIKVGS
jgi:hypothetical protein